MPTQNNYETVIGLEIHLQLATKSKAFCGDDTTFGGEPNTHVSAISLGHPGTLPRLNKKQAEYAVKLGLALGSDINKRNCFDRKNYFYTDLPKGYQITQDNLPICVGGGLEIRVGGEKKYIRLHHIHMEEDAGKSIHDIDPKNSMIDLNRAGVPLLEIVTEPDLRSGEEVDAFMTAMRQLARYLEISDGNMQEGSMRCDVNVSVRKKGEKEFGERCEIKNVNSMKFARQAIKYESQRQINLLEKGEEIKRSTLNFDPATGRTSPMRDKEDAHDYRYFPDPDLPPVILSENKLEEIKSNMPTLPNVYFEKFISEYNLSEKDAELLTGEKEVAIYFEELANSKNLPNIISAAKLTINKILPYISEKGIPFSEFPISNKNIIDYILLIENGKVSPSIANQRLFPVMADRPEIAPEKLAEELNLIQSDDEDFLEKIVDDILSKNPDKVKAYKNGKKGLIGFFMGQVMKASQGKAEPKKTNALLAKKLSV